MNRFAPWFAGVVLALPVLLARYPPMADLPAHEAVVGLLRHWGDARYVPPGVYALNLGHPNQLLYFLILPLAYVVPIGTATKLVVAATLAFLPVAAGRLADHLGVTRWTSLLVAPLALGWMFFWGLLANLMGLGAYLFALPALDRFVDRPTARRFAGVLAWLVLLHFLHDFMALVAALTLVTFTLCAWRGWRQNLARLAPAAVVLALALASRAMESRAGYTAHQQGIAFAPLVERIVTIPGALFAGDSLVTGVLFALAAIALLLFALEAKNAPAPRAMPRRYAVLAGVLVALYFVAPMAIGWTTQIHQRFLPVAWCLAVVALGPHASVRPLPRIAAVVLLFAPILTTWPEFVASDRTYRDLDAVMEHIEPGSAHAILELGPNDDPLFSPVTCGGRIVAVRGGRSLFDYSRSPASPVVQRPEVEWNEAYERVDHHTYAFVPAHDLTRFRYVVLHTTDAGLGELVRLALAPDARLVFKQGELTLLESTLPRVPIDAPDDPFPPPHPATLDERAIATSKGL